MQGQISIHVSFDPQARTVLSTVVDTGVGINKNELTQLFKLFGKLKGSSNVNKSGIGLGLNICKQIVTVFDGEIHCESQLGKGSSFMFKWKLTEVLIGPQALENQRFTEVPHIPTQDICNLSSSIEFNVNTQRRKKEILPCHNMKKHLMKTKSINECNIKNKEHASNFLSPNLNVKQVMTDRNEDLKVLDHISSDYMSDSGSISISNSRSNFIAPAKVQ